MILIVLITFLLLLLCWFLLAPFELGIDTRVPHVYFKWMSIGKIVLVYDKNEWWLKLQVLFFNKNWIAQQLFHTSGKRQQPAKHIKKKKVREIQWGKFFTMLKTFKMVQWQIAADTGNYPVNARLFPLNFYPPFNNHININFNEENYVVFKCRNTPWRILFAWIK